VSFGLINPYSIGSLKNLPIKLYKGTYLLVTGTVTNPIFLAAPMTCSMVSSAKINNKYKVVDYTFNLGLPYSPLKNSILQIIVP
jgi:hypothetical protein